MPDVASQNPVVDALANARRRLVGVAGVSGAINLLMLSGSIYMLQVYDRVLPSRNVSTLLGLSILVLAAYLLQGCLDAIRSRMLARISALFDAALQEPIYRALVDLPLKGSGPFDRCSSRYGTWSRSAPSCQGWGQPLFSICHGCRFSCSCSFSSTP